MASRYLSVGALVICLAVALLGCSQQASPPQQSPQAAQQASPQASAPKPATVQVGELQNAADAPMYIAFEKGYYKEQGITVEFSSFKDTNAMVPLLAQGQLHVGSGGVSAALFNAVARDIPLKIVADKSHREKGETAAGWVVRKELLDGGQVKTAADFKGKTIGMGSRGGQPEMELEILLKKFGLTPADVTLKDIAYTDQVVAFANKSIDIAYTFEPYTITLRDQNLAGMFLPSADVIPGNQVSVVIFSPSLWQQPDVAQRWMVAYLKGVREYNAAFHEGKPVPQDIIDILVKRTTVKNPESWAKMRPNNINPDGYLSVDTLEQGKDWFKSKGLLQRDVQMKDIVDHSFVDAAIATLGKYKKN